MAFINIGEETEQREFKKSTSELKEGVISIASILNKHGQGELYFGVKNNGDVIGQEVSESTARDVSQAIRANIKPAIYPVVEKQNYGERTVVYVKFEGKQRPYLAYGIPRIRIADEDIVMDQDKYNEMLHERENRIASWETQVSRYSVADIDKDVFASYLRKARQVGRITLDNDNPQDILTKLELVEGERLLNAFAHRIIESAQSVEVAIYKSFIEIYSPGKFPNHVTPEQFITEVRKPIRRNPLITRTLYYSKDMESFATGLKRIHDACREAGVKVEFYGDEYGFTVRFYRHCGEGWGKTSDSKTPKHQNEALKEALDDALEVKLLAAIKKQPAITQQELVRELSVSRATVQRLFKAYEEKTLASDINPIEAKAGGEALLALDGSLTDDRVMQLVGTSFRLTGGR